jgi:hypothetical protein
MPHEQHYSFGIMAWCANPERVEVMRNEHGYTTGQCPLVREGFEVEAPEPEDQWPEPEPLRDTHVAHEEGDARTRW